MANGITKSQQNRITYLGSTAVLGAGATAWATAGAGARAGARAGVPGPKTP